MLMAQAGWSGADENEAGVFALMGAVAMLGGVQRSAVSLCIIILEGTGQIQFLLPIIWTTVFSRYIGNSFNEGLYELAIHVKRAPFIEHQPIPRMATRPIERVMAEGVKTLPVEGCTVQHVYALLRSCWHNGFPVVDSQGRMCGLVLRSQLQVMISNIAFHTRGVSDMGQVVESEEQMALLKMMVEEEAVRSTFMAEAGGVAGWRDDDESSIGEGLDVEQGGQEGANTRGRKEGGRERSSTDKAVKNGGSLSPGKGQWLSKSLDKKSTLAGAVRSVSLLPKEEQQQPGQQYRYRTYVENMQVPKRKWKSKLVEDSTLDSFNLSGQDMKGILIDIKFAMNTAIHTVQRKCPVSHAYSLFYTMGMRHLVVVDVGGVVVGIVTRKDICNLFHEAKEMKASANQGRDSHSGNALKESFFSVTWHNLFHKRGGGSGGDGGTDDKRGDRMSASTRPRAGSAPDMATHRASVQTRNSAPVVSSEPGTDFLSWLPAPMLSPPPSTESSPRRESSQRQQPQQDSGGRASGRDSQFNSLLNVSLDEPLPEHLAEI
jgi:hypothetical protein